MCCKLTEFLSVDIFITLFYVYCTVYFFNKILKENWKKLTTNPPFISCQTAKSRNDNYID